jgi:hypothetical protein
MAENKHQQLVNSICDAVVAALKPLFEAQTTQNGAEFANVNTLIAALVARVEVMEKGAATTGGAKRAPRGERKTGGATAAAAKTNSDDPLDKVKNAMLFARRMWADDEAFRAKYMSEAVQAEIDGDDKTTKHADGSEARWLAEGSLFWRKCATAQQKKDIRDEFNRWKEERERSALAEPLGADDGADDDGEEDA